MKRPRILLLGAHPDDADIKAGGTCAKWVAHGFTVLLVSVTDGGAGHQVLCRPELVERRRAEALAAGAIIGVGYQVLDLPDGQLVPTLEARNRILRLIREFRPDLVITHRPADYHPDHRYVAQLVQDAAYMVTVPAICPETRHLDRNPIILYFSDSFKRPYPFQPDLAVDIDNEFDQLVSMADCHVSQFYEWLPFNSGVLDQVPEGPRERKQWLAERLRQRIAPLANRYREQILQTYGDSRGRDVNCIEAFEISEYGAPLDEVARAELFPFLPVSSGTKGRAMSEWTDIPE
jgi:LmbE family N-acetylglucosaminyl deacetylase